ncbi:MAG: hypothetical protein AAF492_31575, partial [Verrucomicrobiota bacterium]
SHHGREMGRSICTSLAALSLQAHYRYTPLYGLGYEPDLNSAQRSTADLAQLPVIPLYRRAKRLDAFNTPGNESRVAATEHGDFLYVASDREGGFGGTDLYRYRISGDEPGPAQHLGPEINTKHDESAPVLSQFGFKLVFSSNREDGSKHRLFQATSRPVMKRHNFWVFPSLPWMWHSFKWHLILLFAAVILFVVLLRKAMEASPEEGLADS